MEILFYVLDMILLIWELAVDSGFYDVIAWFFIISLTMMLLAMIFKNIYRIMGEKS